MILLVYHYMIVIFDYDRRMLRRSKESKIDMTLRSIRYHGFI